MLVNFNEEPDFSYTIRYPPALVTRLEHPFTYKKHLQKNNCLYWRFTHVI